MSRALRFMLLASTVLIGALSASLFIAFKTRPLPTLRQLRAVLFDNWGIHGVFQLNAGLLLAAVWILCVHRRKWVALLWIVGIALTGHIATIAYIIWRARTARTIGDVLIPQTAAMTGHGDQGPPIHACGSTFNVEFPDPASAVDAIEDPEPANPPR